MAFNYYSNNGRGGGFLASLPPVTKNLIIINVIVFLATLVNEDFMIGTFALFYPTSQYFHWWQVVTHMFMHGGFWHIFFNMYTLLIFGSVVERYIGPKKFLLFYFVCGLGAVALHFGVEYWQMQSYMEGAALGNATALQRIEAIKFTPTVGASGAIYGVLMGYAMIFPESKMTLLFPPVTLSAKWMVVVFAVIELFTGVTGLNAGIAHFAHLGGMLIGWLMILWWRKRGILFDQDKL
ncbi:MAG: rhomboid family intramembrane serine protease [Bacteroidales bacterium]|nr:rhomboid family intramembrane serine protease [Bacteroidales bacterium]MBR1487300.1 rhomboid family intramembrane serine protease [Bacteroidales bacterium]MBR1577968.1 rhomboid family intramembrane serine protease [Bacteroidales bacterium]